ncbi:MAG: DUF4239 domain-containing protein [Verrucomicrobia bacterium]|nr:DUF4239 domain-containing protein [Verrucomicrobiota bacterium]
MYKLNLMHTLFETSSWVLSSLFIVLSATVLCLGILWFARKKLSRTELKKNHDVAGFTFSIIGVLYSVILGFTVINVQNRYNVVLESIQTEAILLADLYQDAAYFSPDEQSAIRTSLRSYITYVVNEEWWQSGDKTIDMKARSHIRDIWDSYYTVHLKNEKMSLWYTESISKLNSLLNARLTRQFNSTVHLGGYDVEPFNRGSRDYHLLYVLFRP